MSRHGYIDDIDNWQLIMWRGRVTSAIRGKRGQKLLKELRDALDAMPDKRLVAGELQTKEGDVCALGCVGVARGYDLTELDPEQDNDVLANKLDIAECLVREIEYENDDFACYPHTADDDKKRWKHMREWVESNIVKVPNA